MAISATLFKAILSMDSYNRTYGQGINFGIGSDSNGVKIGTATIAGNKGDAEAQSAGFYAIAYTLASGEKVISYRGTDGNPLDIATGWIIGAGLLGTPYNQSKLAVDFYKSVVGTADPYSANISFTGHSLGGGLAGLVSAIYGQNSVIFDNMPFEFALSTFAPLLTAVGAPALNFAGIDGFFVEGEALQALRHLQVTPVTSIVHHGGANLGAVDLHSQSLLVTLMFAKDNNFTDWYNIGEQFINSLFNNDVALAAGANSITGLKNTKHEYSEILRSALAYSVIDEGTRVFGDTGIRALFNDANELGKVMGFVDASSVLKSNAAAISDIFTQFAGQIALAANDNIPEEFAKKAA